MSKVRWTSASRVLNEDVRIGGCLTNPEEVPKGTADGYEPYLFGVTGTLSDGGEF